jgi:uncharacterized membrane protein
MSTPASIKGHPIHPMLIALPVGLWILALVCDVVYTLRPGREVWAHAALVAVGGGVVGALLAAVPGLIDLLSLTDPKVKKIGVWHMIINLAAVAVFAVNFGMRSQRAPGDAPPLILTVIGVALIGVSGWLGGAMVYVHGVAVEPRGSAPTRP